MRFDSFFQVLTVSDIEVAIFFAFQNVGVVHNVTILHRAGPRGCCARSVASDLKDRIFHLLENSSRASQHQEKAYVLIARP